MNVFTSITDNLFQTFLKTKQQNKTSTQTHYGVFDFQLFFNHVKNFLRNSPAKLIITFILILSCVIVQFIMLSFLNKQVEDEYYEQIPKITKSYQYGVICIYIFLWILFIPLIFLVLVSFYFILLKSVSNNNITPSLKVFFIEWFRFLMTPLKNDNLWIYIFGIYVLLIIILGIYFIETKTFVRKLGSLFDTLRTKDDESENLLQKTPDIDTKSFSYRLIQLIGIINITFSASMMFFLT